MIISSFVQSPVGIKGGRKMFVKNESLGLCYHLMPTAIEEKYWYPYLCHIANDGIVEGKEALDLISLKRLIRTLWLRWFPSSLIASKLILIPTWVHCFVPSKGPASKTGIPSLIFHTLALWPHSLEVQLSPPNLYFLLTSHLLHNSHRLLGMPFVSARERQSDVRCPGSDCSNIPHMQFPLVMYPWNFFAMQVKGE